MGIFECLHNISLRLSQRFTVWLNRQTLCCRLAITFLMFSALCLPLCFPTVLRGDKNFAAGKERGPLAPIITTNGTFCSPTLLGSTILPTTSPTPRTTAARKRAKMQKDPVGNAKKIAREERKKNVLFLISDDFRALPRYGSSLNESTRPKLYLPSIERLASESLVLERAYCQYSLCGPSRTSLLTSRSPDTTQVYNNDIYWREIGGPFTTLPQYFKDHGYRTYSMGKVFHTQGRQRRSDPISWNCEIYVPRNIRTVKSVRANWMAVSEEERRTNPLEDDQTVSHASQVLKRLASLSKSKRNSRPFFVAVGFYRPHVPMVCPKEFFEKYPLEEGERYLVDVKWQTPQYKQNYGMASFVEGVADNSNLTNIPDTALRKLRRSYFACLSYVDHLIGVLLKVLDDEGLTDSTIVSFVADHGFHLGENNVISKYTNHEIAVHVPLMIKVPGLTDRGIKSHSLVPLLDIFPTITAAAGLPVPPPCPQRSSDVTLCVEGQSLLPLVDNPELSLHSAVYSQVSRGEALMEYSIRTNRMRYIDFASFNRSPLGNNRSRLELKWDINLFYAGFQRQLYDLARDPDERFNVYDHPEYQDYREHMKTLLRDRFSVI